MSVLTNSQIDFFNQNGYLVIEDYYASEAVQEMKKQVEVLLDSFNLESEETFTTGPDQQKERRVKFLESAQEIHPFLEKMEGDTSHLDKRKLINKIGHALHTLDPVFSKYTHLEKNRKVLADLGMPNMVVPQSMIILKSALTGGEVTPHQDSTFLYTDPLSCVAFWTPLDDSTIENGCIQAIPGSHHNPIVHRFKLRKDENSVYFDPPLKNPWESYPEDLFVPVEVKAGGLLIIHGSLVHMSKKNIGNQDRNVYTWHMVSKDTKWAEDNWIQSTPFEDL